MWGQRVREVQQASPSLAACGGGVCEVEGLGTESGTSSAGRLDTDRLRAFRRLSLESALAEITLHLRERDVRPLLLKGPAFARWLYADPRERTYRDLDLLVGPDSFDAAMRGLAELKYEPPAVALRANERAAHHEQLVRPGAPGTFPVLVELHRTLRLLPASPSLVWQRMSEGVQTIEVAGATVDVPSQPVSALIVSLHAAQHGAGEPKVMCDLTLALDRVDVETWREASALAWELGAGPAFAVGLRLHPTGREVAERLGLDDATPRALRLLAATPPGAAVSVERLVSTHGVGARLRLIASELVPSRDFMRDSSPRARRGALGLIGAYVRRPFQLATKLPLGLRAWLHAAMPSAGAKTPRGPR